MIERAGSAETFPAIIFCHKLQFHGFLSFFKNKLTACIHQSFMFWETLTYLTVCFQSVFEPTSVS